MFRITQSIVLTTLTLSLLASCASQPVNQPTQNNATQAFSQSQLTSLRQKINDDEDFVINLENNPKAALQSQGLNLPANEQVRLLTMNGQIFLILDDRNLKTFHSNLLEPNADKSELQKQLDAVRAKAISDSTFKAKLMANTSETLKAEGIDEGVAGLFEVVDYQPGTSFLLLAPAGVEITRKGCGRGCPTPPPAPAPSAPSNPTLEGIELTVFQGIPRDVEKLLVNTLKAFAIKKTVTKAAVKVSAASMVAGTGLLCGISLGLSKFSCDKSRGLSLSYWEEGITMHLNNGNIRVQ